MDIEDINANEIESLRAKVAELEDFIDYYKSLINLNGYDSITSLLVSHKKLQAQLDAKWISVADRMPDEVTYIDSSLTKSNDVLVLLADKRMKVGFFINGGMFGRPTHWMPLPLPPRGEV